MIFRLYLGVVVRDDYLITADDGADGGPRRKMDLLHDSPDHLRGIVITVGDRLEKHREK